jgi:serralysin
MATTTAITGTITNDDSNPPQVFTPSQDTLTGLSGPDLFQLTDLKNSLFVSSTVVDKVTSLATTEDKFDSPFRTTAITPTAAGSASALTASGIANRLNTNRFVANGAATFTFGNGASQRTFLGINDGVAGYKAANDAIIEITGFTGALTSLLVV